MIRLANADKGRFGGLFKPAWQSRSADKRLSAVARLDTDDAKDRAILGQLARDPEDAVALAAIARVDDLAVLDRLIEERPGESRQGAARRRFGELLADAESIDFVTATARLGELPGRVAEFAAHAAFEHTRGGFSVTDLDSTNGTKVNGEKVASRLLASRTIDSGRLRYEAALPPEIRGRFQIRVGTLRGGVTSATFRVGAMR